MNAMEWTELTKEVMQNGHKAYHKENKARKDEEVQERSAMGWHKKIRNEEVQVEKDKRRQDKTMEKNSNKNLNKK